MFKEVMVLVALVPLMNFLHEGGHWLGGALIGAKPKMLLQRVEIGEESRFSDSQVAIYNWGGPVLNYAFIGAGIFYAPLLPLAVLMTCHRLGPNVFASILYLRGNRNFTTDETKQFHSENRLPVALFFSAVYFVIAILLMLQWRSSTVLAIASVIGFSMIWFAYLIFLDQIDRFLMLKS
jgi:hypothetical protein